MQKILLAVLISLIFSLSYAAEPLKPLPSEQAFVFTTYVDKQNNITFQWNIAPGYYLYKNKFNFTVAPTSPLKIGKIVWPAGTSKKGLDGTTYPTFLGLVKVTVPLLGSFRGPIQLTINYQGCSLSGFCYAPIKKYLNVDLTNIKPMQDLTKNVSITSEPQPFLSDQDMSQAIFAGHSVFFILISFLGLGLLLAFTPCVLPMIPILSGIIAGHKKKVSTLYAFTLSSAYVSGMAIMYAIAGVIVALLGSSIQVFFQKPWVIFLFSGFFVLLSLSLFGFYELQLPRSLNKQTTRWSNHLKGGSFIGVFLMGCLSTLIVSPCVSAPLVGVLAYIAQTGNVFFGAMALLMLGIGMGIPLLLIGTSAGKWLPKAGHWMELVKKLFGVLMLGVAIWMLSRIISPPLTLLLWALLCLGVGIYLIKFYKVNHRGVRVLRTCAVFLLVYGALLLVGAGLGKTDPLKPWDGWNENVSAEHELPGFFSVFHNEQELDQQLALAKEQKKFVVLDFYATWCVSCVMMDKQVLNRESIRNAMYNFIRLRADVTDNSDFDQKIMKRYHVVAPPTMIFINQTGQEISSARIVGEVDSEKLLAIINKVREQ